MTSHRASRLMVNVLQRLTGDNDALVGDLIEEYPHRSKAWICRQVLGAAYRRLAIAARSGLREPQQLAGQLALVGILLALGFQIGVAAKIFEGLMSVRYSSSIRTPITRPAASNRIVK